VPNQRTKKVGTDSRKKGKEGGVGKDQTGQMPFLGVNAHLDKALDLYHSREPKVGEEKETGEGDPEGRVLKRS